MRTIQRTGTVTVGWVGVDAVSKPALPSRLLGYGYVIAVSQGDYTVNGTAVILYSATTAGRRPPIRS